MLILTRKIDQSIVIQGNITIMVLGVERDRVKLGIQAPPDVAVLREELMAGQAEDNGIAQQPVGPPWRLETPHAPPSQTPSEE
jgi:carbon storage regulator